MSQRPEDVKKAEAKSDAREPDLPIGLQTPNQQPPNQQPPIATTHRITSTQSASHAMRRVPRGVALENAGEKVTVKSKSRAYHPEDVIVGLDRRDQVPKPFDRREVPPEHEVDLECGNAGTVRVTAPAIGRREGAMVSTRTTPPPARGLKEKKKNKAEKPPECPSR